jgi:molybdopterin/thiamine biosynthesis adenylyltransferase
MSRAAYSVAMTEELAGVAHAHLLRQDRQEDLCFALWRPSAGRSRMTALIHELVLPREGERRVHGNVSFEPAYFERAMTEAAAKGAGLALMHSHPRGRGWQGMSLDDVRAEQGNAGAVFGATRKPFVGLTIAGDGSWSGRFWMKTAPRTYARQNCATVRVAGNRIKVTYLDELAPPPVATAEQIRTVSAWGEETQRHIARLRVGLIGSGSVGGLVGDAVVRTGFEDMMLMDFDFIEIHNLDRLSYATRADVGQLKVEVQAAHLIERATAESFRVETVPSAVFEEEGFRAALDCDVLFACVDRPWGRYILNLIAYAHLIPVIDGGIAVRCNKHGKLAAADWKAHTATAGRPCLQCLHQYDPGLVQAEREGLLDDPDYISGLPNDHPLKMRENVFAFSMSCAGMQMLQMLALTVDPLGQPNPGAQLYHFVGNITEPPAFQDCHPECQFPSLVALGDDCGIRATGPRKKFLGNGSENVSCSEEEAEIQE